MVTAEFAASFPTIVVVLALALAAVGAATAQLRCVDAARTGARAMARGEAPAAAVAAARGAAPTGADVRIVRHGTHIRVEVRGRVALLGPLTGRHWTMPVSADAVAEVEPAVAPP
jgi:hypothetical protein